MIIVTSLLKEKMIMKITKITESDAAVLLMKVNQNQ